MHDTPKVTSEVMPVIAGWPVAQKRPIKMVYLIGPDGLVNQRFANFHKVSFLTTVMGGMKYLSNRVIKI